MKKKKILVLAANPQGTDQLRLDREIKAIEEAVWGGTKRDNFTVISKVAVKTSELQSLLRREKPRIVHFCGHGAGQPGLIFHSENDSEQLVSNQGIARLFKKYANKIECVILNACYSKVQGEAINQHINHVIGTKGAIRNDAAIAFSKGFYESLADGESIASAMEDGRDRIQLDIVNSGYSKRKLIPVVSEIEEEWLPEEEILTLLTKQQLNEIYETVSENATSSHAQNVTVQGGVKRQVLFQNMTVKNDTNDNDDPEAYAIAQIKDHQSGQPFYLGRTYELQAGIRTQILEGFKGEPVQLLDKQEPIQLEIVVWAEDMEIEPAWMQPYLFSRTEETAKAEFQIKPTQSGRRQVRVEFFYQLHWLAKIQFEIEVVEAEEIVLAS